MEKECSSKIETVGNYQRYSIIIFYHIRFMRISAPLRKINLAPLSMIQLMRTNVKLNMSGNLILILMIVSMNLKYYFFS